MRSRHSGNYYGWNVLAADLLIQTPRGDATVAYDFVTKTLEQRQSRSKLPGAVWGYIMFAFAWDILGLAAAIAFGNFPVRLLWFLWSTVVYVLTIQLVTGKKPWARRVLMVLMFPIGTMLLSKGQVSLYMRQES